MTLTEIQALAEDYALKYNPEHLAPFPYENVTERHSDLRIYFTALDDDDVSGAILFQASQFNILVNSNKPETRQHFTLAHELGHYFLHPDTLKREQVIVDGEDYVDGPNILYRLDDAEAKRLEKEANNFAASLLLPTDLVRRAWEATGRIEDCARIFGVSPVAMTIRLINLGFMQE